MKLLIWINDTLIIKYILKYMITFFCRFASISSLSSAPTICSQIRRLILDHANSLHTMSRFVKRTYVILCFIFCTILYLSNLIMTSISYYTQTAIECLKSSNKCVLWHSRGISSKWILMRQSVPIQIVQTLSENLK